MLRHPRRHPHRRRCPGRHRCLRQSSRRAEAVAVVVENPAAERRVLRRGCSCAAAARPATATSVEDRLAAARGPGVWEWGCARRSASSSRTGERRSSPRGGLFQPSAGTKTSIEEEEAEEDGTEEEVVTGGDDEEGSRTAEKRREGNRRRVLKKKKNKRRADLPDRFRRYRFAVF